LWVTLREARSSAISGRGSNMMALANAMPLALVVSNVEGAAGLEFAAAQNIKTALVVSKGKTREAFEDELHACLISQNIEFIALAGFMRLLTVGFVNKWAGRMINIHPALLPKFKGLETHKRALEAGETTHGATVHYVTPQMDEGEIIMQRAVPILPDDTEYTLAARVLAVEHEIYPIALLKALQK
jgi:phosphoribosylglycinamide formyltransferase 1